MYPLHRDDWGELLLEVPLGAVGRIIGRGGSNVRALREESACHIDIAKQVMGRTGDDMCVCSKQTSQLFPSPSFIDGPLLLLLLLRTNKFTKLLLAIWPSLLHNDC
jgi:hypothetical protein